MTILGTYQVMAFLAVIEQAGIPALRIAFTIAVIVFLLGGISIFRRRHQFFDRDPDVDNDVPVVRRNREEAIMFVWGGLTLVLLYVLDQVWSA
ncbi:MAG TPA: hypothetical protein VJK31_06580 [Chthoniobacterales bacterium]|jgi:hypothetical protein|nr:hypothetical protein [Chthoniobacterales bacterium]